MQASAGLQDKIGGNWHDIISKAGDGIQEIVKDFPSFGKISLDSSPPSDKERGDAEKALEGRMSKLIPEADREAMKAMTTAITNGDSKAFAEAVKKAGGNPEKLKALVSEVDKMLEEKGSSTRLDVTADGKVLVTDGFSGKGVAFDPKTGNVEAKAIEQNIDGSVLVKPGELLHVDTTKLFKDMGDDAVNAVNGRHDITLQKPNPFFPDEPFAPKEPRFPRDPEFPHLPENPLWPKGGFDPKWLYMDEGSKVKLLDKQINQ